MDVCGGCGRPRKQGAAFCTGCGRRFTDDWSHISGPAASAGGQQRVRHAGASGLTRPRQSLLTPRAAVIVTVTAAFAALSVAGIVLLTAGHRAQHSEAAGNSGKSTQLSTLPSQDGSGRAPGSSGPPTGPSSVGQVTVTAAASQDENASSVATFLDSYFNAINTRDYPSYISMLSPQAQQGLTAKQFDSGYRSTVDSAETLVSISVVTNGDLVAAVTFTSHQNPVDSPDRRQSCTDWNISLFLEQDGRGYLIDRSPPGYHASYNACA